MRKLWPNPIIFLCETFSSPPGPPQLGSIVACLVTCSEPESLYCGPNITSWVYGTVYLQVRRFMCLDDRFHGDYDMSVFRWCSFQLNKLQDAANSG